MNTSHAVRIVFACLSAALFASCSASTTSSQVGGAAPFMRPDDSVTANVTWTNNSDKYLRASVDWAYQLTIWHTERTACVAPKQHWTTHVDYNHPSIGPQIGFDADLVDGANCSGKVIEPRWVDFKDLKFSNGSAQFTADSYYDSARKAYALCAEGGGNSKKCVDHHGLPPDR